LPSKNSGRTGKQALRYYSLARGYRNDMPVISSLVFNSETLEDQELVFFREAFGLIETPATFT
jgi:hypothetical protein